MHRYALDTVIVDEFDDPVTDTNPATKIPFTVNSGFLFRRALISDRAKNLQPGQSIDTELKAKRFSIFQKIKASKERFVDLDIEEVKLLDDAIEVYGTLIHGQLRAVLNHPIPEAVAKPAAPPLDCSASLARD